MKKLLLSLMLPLLLVGIFPARVHADTQDFVINNFDADYTLTADDKQGSMRVVEKIDLTFNDNNHGILRAVPNSYKKQSLNLRVNDVSSTTGAPSSYTTSGDSGNTVIKIGDAGKTITGHQQYTIDYTVDNVISFYDDHDEFYWDINGDQWLQPFTHVKMTLHLPSGLQANGQLACYGGRYGATAQACTISQDGQTITSETTTALLSSETLTTIVGFNKGFFAAPTLADTLRDYTVTLVLLLLIPIVVFVYSFKRWRKFGRDPKGAGTIVPEYNAPDGLRPMEVGALLNFRADN